MNSKRKISRQSLTLAELALKHFHAPPENMNCVQSVMKSAQEEAGITDQEIADARSLGRGKAEGGCCGALFAAKQILGSTVNPSEIEERFSKVTGGTRCRHLRELNKVPCTVCVSAAAELVEEFLWPDDSADQ